MALLTTGLWLELNVRRFCVNSAEGVGGGARCSRNHTRPEAAVSASSPASPRGQRCVPPPRPPPRDPPLPWGEGLPSPSLGDGERSRTVGVRGPVPTEDRPASVSRFSRFRSARISLAL